MKKGKILDFKNKWVTIKTKNGKTYSGYIHETGIQYSDDSILVSDKIPHSEKDIYRGIKVFLNDIETIALSEREEHNAD